MKRKIIFDLLAILMGVCIAAIGMEVAVRAFVDDGMQYDRLYPRRRVPLLHGKRARHARRGKLPFAEGRTGSSS